MNREPSIPRFFQIEQQLVRDIVSSGMKPGDIIPSGREIAKRYGVAYNTARRALYNLTVSGIIRREANSMACLARIPQLPEASRPTSHTPDIRNIVIFAPTRYFDGNSSYETGFYRCFEKACEDKKWNVLLSKLSRYTDPNRLILEAAPTAMIDGVLVIGVYYEDILQKIHDSRLPTVVVDCSPASIHLDSVGTNNLRIAQQAMSRLLELGHRRIDYIGHYHDEDRDKDFDAMEIEFHWRRFLDLNGADGDPHYVIPSKDLSVLARRFTTDRSSTPPTAILVSNPNVAETLYAELKKQGVQIPKDISIIACGNNARSRMRVSAVDIDWNEIAKIAVMRLEGLITGEFRPGARLSHAGTLIERGSVAPCHESGASRE